MSLNGAGTLTIRTYLVRGLLAGLIAGVLTFVAAYAFGEQSVDAAISVEEGGHTGQGAEEPVSRQVQSTWGLATGTVAMGLALGGILGLATAFGQGRLGRLRPREVAVTLAGIGFVAVCLVPFVKYPANPPAVGQADTIGQRTAMYMGLLAISVGAAILAVVLRQRLARIVDGFVATLLAGAAFVVLAGLAIWLFPAINEVPADFPATLLFSFRRASVFTQFVLWSTLGVSLALLLSAVSGRVTRHREALGA